MSPRFSKTLIVLKRTTAVVNHFCDHFFKGYFRQSIHRVTRDDEIFASQLHLSEREEAFLFINALAPPASDVFFDNSSANMNYNEILGIVLKLNDSPTRQRTAQA